MVRWAADGANCLKPPGKGAMHCGDQALQRASCSATPGEGKAPDFTTRRVRTCWVIASATRLLTGRAEHVEPAQNCSAMSPLIKHSEFDTRALPIQDRE